MDDDSTADLRPLSHEPWDDPGTAVAVLVMTGPLLGRVFLVGAADTVLGRGRSATIDLRVREVSRTHARLYLRAGCLLIADCDSRNGTWVNGVRITEPFPLVEGDTVRIGYRVTIRIGRVMRDAAR